MNAIREKYEISVWEDLPIADDESNQRYEEVKIATIGAHNMDTEIRALEPVFYDDVNQTSNLSFKMVAKYWDYKENRLIENPFINLLVLEKKIKFNFRGEWKDYIIKDVDESSTGKFYSYKCQDLASQELSRSGNEITLATELKNNLGTIEELAEKALRGTDWVVKTGSKLREKKEEPVYHSRPLTANISAKSLVTGESSTLPQGKEVLIFYSDFTDIEAGKTTFTDLQIGYADNFEKDTDNLILNKDYIHILEGASTISKSEPNWVIKRGALEIRLPIASTMSKEYRAEKFVRGQRTTYDPAIDKFVKIYEKVSSPGEEVYGYEETTYNSPTVVQNIITNGVNFRDFDNITGWTGDLAFKVHTRTTPDKSYSSLVANLSASKKIQNSAFKDHVFYFPEGVVKGEKFIVKYKAYEDIAGEPGTALTNKLRFSLTGQTGAVSPSEGTDEYMMARLTIPNTKSYSDIARSLGGGLDLSISASDNKTYWIEEVKLFKEVLDKHGKYIDPDQILTDSVVETIYAYYDPLQGHTNREDLVLLRRSAGPLPLEFKPKYNQDYEKMRLITIEKSNRYNIIQTLCETFETWVKFEVQHDEDGKMTLDENKKPIKTVTFKEVVGQENPLSFTYGLDLIDINRKLNSNKITTKIIVAANSNQFAPNGSCNIRFAEENFSKERFLFNFQYYVNQGMINPGALQADLYGRYVKNAKNIGFLNGLHQLNTLEEPIVKEQTQMNNELMHLRADESLAEARESALSSELIGLRSKLFMYTGRETMAAVKTWINDSGNENHDRAQTAYVVYSETEKLLAAHTAKKNNLTAQIEATVIKSKLNKEALEESKIEKEALNERFNSRYFRYIQEGTWISEDYIDPNLYYYDAVQTLQSSAFPEVTYNINVVNLAALPEYKSRKFQVGDITSIQDVEFFGYETDGVTPYKEKVTVTGITYYLDTPEKDVITIQNYKTQFQDLFQRTVAASQQLQYSSGSYNKVAGIINTDGTIKKNILENSLIVNADLVYGSRHDSFIVDSTGATMTDLDNVDNIVKLTSKGLFFTDNGLDWRTGITSKGIATDSLTAGFISTDKIVITKGGAPTFRWDEVGLTAYYFEEDIGVDSSRFVRFDQYGLYGILNNSGFEPKPTYEVNGVVVGAEKHIWDNAGFALTWSGFNIKTIYGSNEGFLRFSSGRTNDQDNGIVLGTGSGSLEVVRVKIGLLGPNNYGLELRDATGNSTLRMDDQGKLRLDDAMYIRKGAGETGHIAIGNLDDLSDEFDYVFVETVVGEPVLPGLYDNKDPSGLTTDTVYQDRKTYYTRKTQVFNSNSNFIVYKDGSIVAKEGEFIGHVRATSGSFEGTIYANEGNIGPIKITGNGLSMNSGSFIITDDAEEPNTLFSFNEGVLSIAGQGSFTGKITAESGNIGGIQIIENMIFALDSSDDIAFSLSSTGELVSKSGSIGGIKIHSNSLQSENFDEEAGIGFSLAGNDIIANSIILGDQATIKNRLILGDEEYPAIIYNPAANAGNLFIDSGDIKIYSNGIADFGSIHVDGTSSVISTENAWSLTPLEATFNNISASGSISTMVFETNSTQAAGGSMIFKASAKVINGHIGNLTIKSSESSTFRIGSWVLIDLQNSKLELEIATATVLEDEMQLTFIDSASTDFSNAKTIISLGELKDGSPDGKDWVIGINASSTPFQNMLSKNAITFSSIERIGPKELKYNKKIVLGSLVDVEEATGRETYGLYAETAYLTGTLTTQGKNLVTEGSNRALYAGVNTLDSAPFTEGASLALLEGGEPDTSPIIFWAGALGVSSTEVQASPFQVTSNGTLFAQRGYFRHSVISDAIIKATTLQAVTIEGVGNSPALKIIGRKPGVNQNTDSDGIHFYVGEDDPSGVGSTLKTVWINSEGLFMNSDGVLQIGTEGIKLEAGVVNAKSLHLGSVQKNFTITSTKPDNTSYAGEAFAIKHGTKVIARVTDTQFEVDENLHSKKNVVFGGAGGRISFEKVSGGYNIYVSQGGN